MSHEHWYFEEGHEELQSYPGCTYAVMQSLSSPSCPVAVLQVEDLTDKTVTGPLCVSLMGGLDGGRYVPNLRGRMRYSRAQVLATYPTLAKAFEAFKAAREVLGQDYYRHIDRPAFDRAKDRQSLALAAHKAAEAAYKACAAETSQMMEVAKVAHYQEVLDVLKSHEDPAP